MSRFLLFLLLFYLFRKKSALNIPLFSMGFGNEKKFVGYC